MPVQSPTWKYSITVINLFTVVDQIWRRFAGLANRIDRCMLIIIIIFNLLLLIVIDVDA